MGLIGLTMLFFGLKWSLKSFKSKKIIEFPILDSVKEFEIINPGLYSFCIIGGGYVHNSEGFKTLISNVGSQKSIDLEENIIKPRFRKNWKMGVEYLQFKINNIGNYKIEIQNPEKLIVKKSMLKTKQIFQSNQLMENIEILIKETIPVKKKLFGILFLVLGVNMSAWGIMLTLNPSLLL